MQVIINGLPAPVFSYVRSLRNAEKRRYAQEYARHRCDPFGTALPNDSTFNLSYMAKQAVRMRLEDLIP